ncbi:MAG: HAD-IB family hydrolase [Gammaproteobacteria bacterium]|nr:HAD-IB family hydrolase [Gammaproteobacteria bacterium]MCW8910205.1 HAD-IB family hydrolase [Gammaproteobacteria bacterium]MCW9004068.1 HAD-IB family hydrolase [Gammaproteobacteria bacterium]MCW9056625.1 HAD-IB family hydrolase [Gammaproteobacteria bacterium]
MALALFDLDNTLLTGDSDYLWGCFLAEQGLVDREFYEQENQRFYDEYKDGTLDIFEFLAFSLKPLADNPANILSALQQQFLDEKIRPIMSPASFELIEKHKKANDTLAVITATNSFVTGPIVKAFGIDNLLATEPEIINNRYTGKVDGIPCFQEGKVKRLESWMEAHNLNLQGSWFYSDSHNDIPLLRQVDNPVAVDPDEQLHQLAINEGWPVISLRHTWK